VFALLEPVVTLTVTVSAIAPLAELFDYATRLRTLTKGRGMFTTTPAGYRHR
jgi:elongation factor G